ncbi:MAG: hypothetical protein ACXAC7_01610 [Candidatus Hodarchaeales archaeon]|jgi:hypothetical protein
MSEAQEIISVINDVIGDVDLPLCIVVQDSEGLELFSTVNCPETGAYNILGIMAFENIKEQILSRTQKNIDLLIFKVEEENYFIAPVAADLYIVANADTNRLGHVLPLLDGMRSQISFKIQQLRRS